MDAVAHPLVPLIQHVAIQRGVHLVRVRLRGEVSIKVRLRVRIGVRIRFRVAQVGLGLGWSTLRANMPDCLNAFSRPSVALSTW